MIYFQIFAVEIKKINTMVITYIHIVDVLECMVHFRNVSQCVANNIKSLIITGNVNTIESF